MNTSKQSNSSLETNENIEIESQWLTIAARRAAKLDSGEVQGIPAEQVFAEVRAMLKASQA